MATIRDVAKRAGVSVATVSYVINGTKPVAPETAARVRRAMAELDYHPNAVAQSLRTRTTHVIGVVVSDIANPFFATLVRGAEDCARQHGYSLLICNTSETLENERIYLNLLSRRRVDGLLLAPTGKNDELIGRLIDRGMQIVTIDRKVQGVNVPAIMSENEQGAFLATKHLLELGHRRIAIVLGLPHLSTTLERLKGYQKALTLFRAKEDPRLIVYGQSQVGGAREAALKLLSAEEPPTAVFATNNLMTLGVMMAVHELGLRCPQDISVVGFDDFEWSAAFNPPITTVAQDPYLMGKTAVEVLLERLRGKPLLPETIRIPVRFIPRASTKQLDNFPTRKGGDS